MSKYKWTSNEKNGAESLIISLGLLEDHKVNFGDCFYIVVYGQLTATFSLSAYSSNYYDRGLGFDSAENGFLQKENIVCYSLSLDKNMNDKIKLTF